MNEYNFRELVMSDLGRLGGRNVKELLKWYFRPLGSTFPFHFWFRVYQCLKWKQRSKLWKIIPYLFLRHFEYKYGVHVPTDIHVGKGFMVVHGGGVYLNCGYIGDNFTVYQGVTLGKGNEGIPIVGDNVTVFTNAVVCGKIKLEDGVTVGANSFVSRNVGKGLTVAGVPAHTISSS